MTSLVLWHRHFDVGSNWLAPFPDPSNALAGTPLPQADLAPPDQALVRPILLPAPHTLNHGPDRMNVLGAVAHCLQFDLFAPPSRATLNHLDHPLDVVGPQWTLEFGEHRTMGRAWYGFTATLVSPEIGRRRVFAKVGSHCTPEHEWVRDAVRREARAFAKLEALQGQQVPYYYGLWEGEYGLFAEGQRVHVYICVVEDVGASLTDILHGPFWAYAGPWRHQMADLYSEVLQHGVTSWDGAPEITDVCTREDNPTAEYRGPLCLSSLTRSTFEDDAHFGDVSEIQEFWFALERARGP